MSVFSSRPDAGPSDQELAAAGVPQTSPTWELELLISGAVLFALFQLPSLINSFFAHLEPHTTSATASAVFFVHLYVKAIVYALIASFVVHLVARAYWVGLVGLHSVFPHGMRWEEMKVGPISLQVYRERLSSLQPIIARADNFCSVIFSFAFLLALMFAFTILISGLFSAIAYGLAQLFFGGRYVRHFFFGLTALLAAVPMVTAVIDRRIGPRLTPNSRGARMLRNAAVSGYRIGLINIIGPVFLTLLTNIGRGKVIMIFYAAMFSIILFVAAERLANTDRLSVNSYDYYGSSDAHGVNYRFYETQRSDDEILPRTPSIQADIIRDPYVKLFIPYSPARHNALVSRECPGVRPLQDRGFQLGSDPAVPDSLALPVLRCLGRIHAVTLDGTPLAEPDFRFYEHPRSGIKGIIAYIPVDSLARGRHVLVVKPAPRIDAGTPRTPPRPYVIPFWK